MLRCPPSRITLTSSDIADFEHRFAARRMKGKTAKVRLSPSPAHSTKLSFVPAERNIGRIRAASSSSEATIHNDLPTPEKDDKFLPILEAPVEADISDTYAYGGEADPDLDGLLHQAAPSTATPRRQVDSFYGTEQALDLGSEFVPAVTSVDGTTESQPYVTPASRHFLAWTSRGREVLGEINRDAYPTDHQPRTDPPLLASARARRRQTRSQDIYISREPDEVQEATIQSHNYSIPSQLDRAFLATLEVPALVLPRDDSIVSSVSALDPGAPVFLPRTRFGTVSGSSQDVAAAQIEIRSYCPDLRVRSSSERNAEMNGQTQGHRSALSGESVNSTNLSAFQNSELVRRRTGITGQYFEVSNIIPVLERYPLMRPVSRGDEQSNDMAPRGSVQADGNNLHATVDRQRSSTGNSRGDIHLQVRRTPNTNTDKRERSGPRSVSPTLSAGSRSTPNLLQYPNTEPRFSGRGSSLPWNRIDPQSPYSVRVSSMTSANSGMSGGRQGSRQVSRQSSREALEAATEFLRMRNSPLDDLTEQFSRMSASRPRSVGRSWERPPGKQRISLLTGDPFKPEPTPRAPPRRSNASTEVIGRNTGVLEGIEDVDPLPEDVVALALALPPSSPLPSSSVALPSTPSLHFIEAQSPRSSANKGTAARSPESSITRKPVQTAIRTPKVTVYDDRRAPDTQPQTPADMRGSKRRAKTRSDIVVAQPPIYVGQAMMSTPPSIPERHPHRNTYPSTAPTLDNAHVVAAAPARPAHAMEAASPVSSRRTHNRGRFRARRSGQQAENDLVEGHLRGLEADRRTYAGRREHGNLDTTPPREGRFERYLS